MMDGPPMHDGPVLKGVLSCHMSCRRQERQTRTRQFG